MATENYAAQQTNGDVLEKDFHLDDNHSPDAALSRIRTAGSISISPELFEKIYLSPQNRVKGDLRKTFANPTPLCLIGFLLALFPLSFSLMGWRGAGVLGAATIGCYYFAGGLLMVLGSVGEFILGNTFPFIVFGSFGSFWLIYAATLTPYLNAQAAYATSDAPDGGLTTIGFNSSFAPFQIAMGMLCLFYLICALRTNLIFVGIFFFLTIAFGLLAGVFWQTANAIGQTAAGDAAGAASTMAMAADLQIAAGAFTFATCILGWYLFLGIMLASVDFPIALPVFDLSSIIKGASDRKREREQV